MSDPGRAAVAIDAVAATMRAAGAPMWLAAGEPMRFSCNAACAALLGIDPGTETDADPGAVWGAVSPAGWAALAPLIDRVTATGREAGDARFLVRARDAGQPERRLRCALGPLLDPDGAVAGVLGVLTHDSLAAAIGVHDAERDRHWELSEDLLVIADYEGTLRRVSPSWTRVLGYGTDALLATRYDALVHPEDRDQVASRLRAARGTGAGLRFEVRLRTIDGDWRWIAWALVPEAPGGDRVFGIGRDVTASRLAHDALLAQIEERERVETTLSQMQRLEAVGQLTSGVAHDFNNMLTVVLGSIEFIERKVDQPAVRRRLDMMRSAATRGAEITAQLLAFSRKQHLDPRPVDLNDTVRGMRELLRTTMGGAAPLRFRLDEDLSRALADRTQLELVILNLAINARDAMPDGGGLTIETANVTRGAPATPEEPASGDYVMIAVTDEGTGIPESVRARVFEPFFTTKEPGRRSGLGLAQVYGFAKQSGGGVSIETAVGKGTSVRVFLPQVAASSGRSRTEAASPPVPRGMRVLLVDDDRNVREVGRRMLEELGYEVADAEDGEAALAVLDEGLPIDMVVTDFAMPGMTGAELAAEIGRRAPGLPLVVVTGYADARIIRDAIRLPLVAKPFTREQIADALHDAAGGT